MTISPTAVRFDEHTMWVDLTDGRTIGAPLAWFPRLLNATMQQRKRVEVSRLGLHWEDLDEDISIAGLLAGRGDLTQKAAKTTMPKQSGLDHRHRDIDGEIRRKDGNTLVGTLRKTYGDDFAKGYRGDMK